MAKRHPAVGVGTLLLLGTLTPCCSSRGGHTVGTNAGTAASGAGGASSLVAGHLTGADSGSSEAGAGQADSGIAPSAVADLTVEPNPNNTLSAYVSWTTDQPSNSEVQFGIGAYEFRIVHESLVTEHRVLVIGLYADNDYMIRAVSTNSAGSVSGVASFRTGSLPDIVKVPELGVFDQEASLTGWTLTNLQVGAGSTGLAATHPAVVVMYDQYGVPVWYYVRGDQPDARGDVSTELLNNGNVLIGPTNAYPPVEIDLAGNIVWQGPPQPADGHDLFTHHAGKLQNGDYVLLRDRGSGAEVEEVTPDDALVWKWNLFDHIIASDASGDWCHGNAVTIDPADDVLYLNCRFQGIFKAKRSGDQSVLWHMPASIDAAVGDVTFSPLDAQFSDIHDPEFHDDGTLLVYDNGGLSVGKTAAEHHSRVLEFALDQTHKKAALIWEFPGDFQVDSWFTDDWYTPIWGDADRLANGNTLITAGMRGEGQVTKIFEVTSSGRVVWEVTMPPDTGSYRAERLVPPPLVEPIAP